MKTIIILSVLLALGLCLFGENSAVVKLTQQNFKSLVLGSQQLWLVEFYAPQFEKAAQILKGIVNLGAVDMTTDGGAGAPYKVQGYPTIKLFGNDKSKPLDYNSGERTFDKFVEYVMGQLKKQVKNREKALASKQ